MMGIIRKLLGEEETHVRRKDYKMRYTTWCCAKCDHSFLYKIHRCPLCESGAIKEVSLPTRYAVIAGSA